ncbi:zinc ribbon domain-containing protein [Spirochaetota bacterium]
MAIYEFKCSSCGNVFSEMRKMGDYHPGKCPECGSEKTEKKFSTFSSVTSDKSAPSCADSCATG